MDAEAPVKHKFLEPSDMTFQDVFDFAYKGLIPVLRGLGREFGQEQFASVLKDIVAESALEAALEAARQLPCNDFAAFKASAREPDRFGRHILTLEIVEDTPEVFEVRVTECLWAKTFRDLGAAEIGSMLICHRDYADCRGFNPRITMIRSKTLMQGDEFCNHRFVWE